MTESDCEVHSFSVELQSLASQLSDTTGPHGVHLEVFDLTTQPSIT